MCNDTKLVNVTRHRRSLAWLHALQFRLFVALAMLLLPLCGVAQAGTEVQLIGAKNLSGKLLLAGVEMTMDPGWYTYWRHPGDSGIAPTFDWSKSENVADVELQWPAPLRFDAPDDLTVGYKDHVVWPVLVRPLDATKPVTLHLSMHYGVCSDICVPGEADLQFVLPDEATKVSGELIRQFLARVPSEAGDGMAISASVEKDQLVVSASDMKDDPALIIEGPRNIWFGKPDAKRDGNSIRYVVPIERTGKAVLKGADVTFIFSGTHTAIKATRKVK